jgi:hypothetical protein
MKRSISFCVCLCVCAAIFFGSLSGGCANKPISHIFDDIKLDAIKRVEYEGGQITDKEAIAALYDGLNEYELTKDGLTLSGGGVTDSIAFTVVYDTAVFLWFKDEKTVVINWTEHEQLTVFGVTNVYKKLYRKSGMATYSAYGIEKSEITQYLTL